MITTGIEASLRATEKPTVRVMERGECQCVTEKGPALG